MDKNIGPSDCYRSSISVKKIKKGRPTIIHGSRPTNDVVETLDFSRFQNNVKILELWNALRYISAMQATQIRIRVASLCEVIRHPTFSIGTSPNILTFFEFGVDERGGAKKTLHGKPPFE